MPDPIYKLQPHRTIHLKGFSDFGAAGLQPFDRVTLWYQNLAFDYILPNPATSVTAASIVANLRDQINATNWAALGVLIPLEATASGADLTITAARTGCDGNMIRL